MCITIPNVSHKTDQPKIPEGQRRQFETDSLAPLTDGSPGVPLEPEIVVPKENVIIRNMKKEIIELCYLQSSDHKLIKTYQEQYDTIIKEYYKGKKTYLLDKFGTKLEDAHKAYEKRGVLILEKQALLDALANVIKVEQTNDEMKAKIESLDKRVFDLGEKRQ